MATTPVNPADFIEMIATEMASGIQGAVQCWLKEVESALEDTRLTTLGRMDAVRLVIQRYKQLSGNERLACIEPTPRI